MPRRYRSGSIARRGRRWLIRWTDGAGIRHAETFPDRQRAEDALASRLGAAQSQRDGMPRDVRTAEPLKALFDRWIEARKHTHRSWRDDRNRWRKHIEPVLGRLRPHEVGEPMLRTLMADRLAAGLSPASVGLLLRLVSTFYRDLVEQGDAPKNPVRALSRATRRTARSTHDPRDTPWLATASDLRAVFLKLPEPVNIAFAVGAMSGMRTGEVLALRWSSIDLERGRIHVRESVRHGKRGPLKDNETRTVPIKAGLVPVLRAWKLRCGHDLVVPPRRKRGTGRHHHSVGELRDELDTALDALSMPRLTWYQATRHTFASQWAADGGDMRELQAIMGHESITTTERYAHLRPGAFSARATKVADVDLTRPEGSVTRLVDA
ncbi:MAG TPA: site-specific integrase [Gaiellales bacterium]|nr:site-specific integrase [Gaiellales bacterium]